MVSLHMRSMRAITGAALRAKMEESTMEDADKLTCIVCEAVGYEVGFKHDCALLFRVEANEDETLSCFLCHGREHIPRPLATSFYTPSARVTVGLHRDCYDRARVSIRMALPVQSA
jgi:hypothetical protein